MNIKISLKAGGVLFHDDWIYVVYRTLTDDYSLPKWHLEESETLKECAIRELKEELWMNVAIENYCDKVAYSYEKEWTINQCIVFFYTMNRTDNSSIPLADDVESYSLVSLDDIEKTLTYESDINIVRSALKSRKNDTSAIPSLYERIAAWERIEQQQLDFETIVWISKKSTISFNTPPQHSPLSLTKNEFTLFKNTIAQKSNFLQEHLYEWIHWIRHSMRVSFFVIVLYKMINTPLDVSVLKAAAFHDVRRTNDLKDSNHWNAWAEWYSTQHGDTQESKYISLLIKYHDTAYDDIPDNQYSEIKEGLDILKLADALDRYRLPKDSWWIDKNYVVIPEWIDIDALIKVCGYITLRSELLNLIQEEKTSIDSILDLLKGRVNE